MIDIKELRVGAYVEHSGKRFRVHALYGELVGIIVGKDDKGQLSFLWIGSDNIDPIPITAALLDEIGFEPLHKKLGKRYEDWYMELDGCPISIMRDDSITHGREWSVSINNLDCDVLGAADVAYLHQLENIIYLCTGKELITEEDKL